MTVKIKELEDNIIFLHKIIKGKANQSFGIEVAKLAGIPIEVIERSKSLLEDFEKDSKTNSFNLKKQEPKSSIKKSSY